MSGGTTRCLLAFDRHHSADAADFERDCADAGAVARAHQHVGSFECLEALHRDLEGIAVRRHVREHEVPCILVTAVASLVPRASLTSTAAAPGIPPPRASSTDPVRVPALVWAAVVAAAAISVASVNVRVRIQPVFMGPPHRRSRGPATDADRTGEVYTHWSVAGNSRKGRRS